MPSGPRPTPPAHRSAISGVWAPPHRISLRLTARLLQVPLKGGRTPGVGWPPLRISCRLAARLLRLPPQGGSDGRVCKPNSVPSQRATVIPLAWELPPRSSILPGCQAARVTPPSLFELAPCGVCQACPLPSTRCALTAPFHPYPLRGGIFSVVLSVPMENVHEPPALRGTLPCGVRTFLPPNAQAMGRRPFDPPDGILSPAQERRQGASRINRAAPWAAGEGERPHPDLQDRSSPAAARFAATTRAPATALPTGAFSRARICRTTGG